MPGPPPKPRSHGGRRERRSRSSAALTLIQPSPPAQALPPKREWLVSTRRRWESFWTSELSQAVSPGTDTAGLERLHDLYDEHERAMRTFRKSRLVIGSQGQPVLNPAGRLLKELAGEIRQLEDRFGLSPLARLRLGHQFGSTALTLDQLNRQLEEDPGDDHEDPRLTVIEAEAPAE